MRSCDSLIRLQRFKVEEKVRDVHDIDSMVNDFAKKETDLMALIIHEEGAVGISDPSHFSYPTTAKASRDRRDNLLKSIEELRVQLAVAEDMLKEERSELRRLELLMEKDIGIRTRGKSNAGSMLVRPAIIS